MKIFNSVIAGNPILMKVFLFSLLRRVDRGQIPSLTTAALGTELSCKRCKGRRIAHIDAKCSDRCDVYVRKYTSLDNYVPDDMGIGGNDHVSFAYCLDCGQMQGDWPMKITDVERGKYEGVISTAAELRYYARQAGFSEAEIDEVGPFARRLDGGF